ncbi:peptidoglycan-binding domain-containing protein [Limnochorda pilosa]|uniref:peptidoglycan-binding domain-containing protein n=1 Tax=Limnochorda pilosa TaxID=1555112 RepID=UPI00130DF13B|nr:peptidoglycan-binding domain-containing protein [Limnochorda pilosa]
MSRVLLALLVVVGLVLLASPAEVEAQGTLGLRTLKPGMWGEDVFELQRLLIRVGFNQPVTGNYGETTTASVRRLQRYGGLAADGVAGPATVELLRQMAERPRYRVQPGDTLYDLSLRFGVSMTRLVDVNLLGHTTLRPGQELVIPDHWIYPVRRGDTLSGIANRFGVSVDSLLRTNRLDDDGPLSLGERLWIPLPDW